MDIGMDCNELVPELPGVPVHLFLMQRVQMFFIGCGFFFHR
jgi:hypothetical protein